MPHNFCTTMNLQSSLLSCSKSYKPCIMSVPLSPRIASKFFQADPSTYGYYRLRLSIKFAKRAYCGARSYLFDSCILWRIELRWFWERGSIGFVSSRSKVLLSFLTASCGSIRLSLTVFCIGEKSPSEWVKLRFLLKRAWLDDCTFKSILTLSSSETPGGIDLFLRLDFLLSLSNTLGSWYCTLSCC